MEHSPWKDNTSSTSERTMHVIAPEVHHCVHKRLPLISVLSQMNPVHSFWYYFLKTDFNNHPLLLFPILLSVPFDSGFLIKTLCISPHACHTPRPSHPPRFYHPNNIWRGQVMEILVMQFFFCLWLLSSSLYPNIFISTLFPNTLSICHFLLTNNP
jgi:hypothetical protein